jgi:hypothetical protein
MSDCVLSPAKNPKPIPAAALDAVPTRAADSTGTEIPKRGVRDYAVVMSRFESNPAGIRRIGKDIAKAAAEAGSEVARSHSGKPEKEIRAALQAAMAKRGYERFEPPDEMVRRIASGNPRRFR